LGSRIFCWSPVGDERTQKWALRFDVDQCPDCDFVADVHISDNFFHSEVTDAFASEMAFYTNIIAGLGIIGWIIAMWYFSRRK
jgi:hypothetical protein